jgi:hypothetical protein
MIIMNPWSPALAGTLEKYVVRGVRLQPDLLSRPDLLHVVSGFSRTF